MKPRSLLLGFALLIALFGAILAFTLEDPDDDWLGVGLQPLGGVLLGAGILLAASIVIVALMTGGSTEGNPTGKGSGSVNSVQAVGGLIAVVCGVGAVGVLTVITVTRFGEGDNETAVAVTSSAFGVISALVGAYLGIKITADTTAKGQEEAKKAAVFQHERDQTRRQVSELEHQVMEGMDPTKASEVIATAQKAREKRPQGNPPAGGGA